MQEKADTGVSPVYPPSCPEPMPGAAVAQKAAETPFLTVEKLRR